MLEVRPSRTRQLEDNAELRGGKDLQLLARGRTKNNNSTNNNSSSNNNNLLHKLLVRSDGAYSSSSLPLLLVLLISCLIVLPNCAFGRQSAHHHRTCPGCPHQHVHTIHRKEIGPSPDDLRLEAIKHQILTKLGLRNRPDVNKTLAQVPRHLALETLYRAEAQPSPEYPDIRNTLHDNNKRQHDDEYGQFFYASDEYSYNRNVNQAEESMTEGVTSTESFRESGYEDYRGTDVEMDDFYARTSEIITFAEPGRTLNGQPLLEFPMSSGEPALEPLKIKRAILWARVELKHVHHYQHHRRQINQRNITLWVFKVRCGNTTHLRGKELSEHLEMVTSLTVNVGQLGWQKFDVTKIVSNWYTSHRHVKERLTLLVDCTGCGTHVHISTFNVQASRVVDSSIDSKNAQDPDRPFLVVRTDPAAVKRVRRRAIECSGALKGQCCKQRFYVSFSQLGWDDWIIAPQGYYANYCRGDCAAGHRTPDTFLNYYTHVIEEYRKMDRLAGMQPCCAPLKFSPMSLIYYGPDSNIIKRDLPKMVVDECGCP
ncbi:inhibin beta chain [Microplitis mediator]|uniref:inhibin beta chain n=1 Tax=Microplitis mediator TaxID=375433 RepID=UPI0025523ACF|nr:inhibin beta chain [Microplitis mediator]